MEPKLDERVGLDEISVADTFSKLKAEWGTHLLLSLFLVLLFDVISLIMPSVTFKLWNLLSPEKRAENRRTQELTDSLRKMSAELKTMNMQDHFAAYSKIQRKMRASERERSQLTSQKNVHSMMTTFACRILLILVNGVTFSYLLTKAPAQNLLWPEGHITFLEIYYNLSFVVVATLRIFRYLPVWVIVGMWFAVCRSLVARLSRIWRVPSASPNTDLVNIMLNGFQPPLSQSNAHLTTEDLD